MAFSFRKIISNISYFSKPGEIERHDTEILDDVSAEMQRQTYFSLISSSENIEFDRVEADSTSKCVSLNLPEPRHYTAQKGSLSDTDLLTNNFGKEDKKKCRKLKLDIKKANQSVSDSLIYSENSSANVENTPKHKLLDCKSAELFRGFNFNQSFDLSDAESDAPSYEEENIDMESISDQSDTDMSVATYIDDKSVIKMCRKVEPEVEMGPVPSATPESFIDVQVDKNEEERVSLLLDYQMKFEKMECFLKNLLSEFQFHIEVSKIFNGKSIVPALPGTDVTKIPKSLGEFMYVDLQRGNSPAWNVVMEKEDINTKAKLKTQLLSMRQTIDQFISTFLQKPKTHRVKKNKINNKKKLKHYDFPDLRDAMLRLFQEECNTSSDDLDCSCHCHSPDSGLITKSEKEANHSITSSIGNFSLDCTTLSAYSESLDQVISYNSFDNTSLFGTLLQKAAIERITFYIQVHSIQLKSESPSDSKNVITFHCPACNTTEYEENLLMKHILSQSHCEKIHFVYKTAYVKKCIGAGKEIQPSTVLNPMTMYRDDNKIVCFGDAMYACSLCFENLMVGESVLMAHCSEDEHIDRREQLSEIFE